VARVDLRPAEDANLQPTTKKSLINIAVLSLHQLA
jgi:hypothetical protein